MGAAGGGTGMSVMAAHTEAAAGGREATCRRR